MNKVKLGVIGVYGDVGGSKLKHYIENPKGLKDTPNKTRIETLRSRSAEARKLGNNL